MCALCVIVASAKFNTLRPMCAHLGGVKCTVRSRLVIFMHFVPCFVISVCSSDLHSDCDF